MTVRDFADWVFPDLVLTLGGSTYHVPPPSVGRARQLVALAVRSEVRLGLHPGPVPDELDDVLAQLDEQPLAEIALTKAVHDRLLADGVPPVTVERMAYYAVHYWARGPERADAIATALWAPHPTDAEPGDAPGEASGR